MQLHAVGRQIRWSRRGAAVGAALALALSGVALAPGTARADTGGQPRPAATRAVALGDSYAAGEGLAPYRTGTDTSASPCHRSPRAYPELLDQGRQRVVRSIRSVACSGARTGALLAPQPDREVPAQVTALSRWTGTVTVTVGGNDLGFSEVLGSCVHSPLLPTAVPGRPGCAARADQAVTLRTARLAGGPTNPAVLPSTVPLAEALTAVARRAPAATIYVTTYPRLFGTSFGDDPAGCRVGEVGGLPLYVTADDVSWIRSKVDGLNAAITAGVQQARAAGARVRTVDVTTPFTSHNVCSSGERWINGLVVTPQGELSPASFHPTARGQRAYADAVAAVVQPRGRG
jgi:lysophospholipase L1-like esterase